jgi:hypothetical protein
MAVKNLEIVVLRGVRVLNDVRMVLERNGSNPAVREPEATSLSHARHLYPSEPLADGDAGTRSLTTYSTGSGQAAHRAGRPARSAGVLNSSRLAAQARQPVPTGRWSVPGLLRATSVARHEPVSFLAEKQRPTMRGSLISWPCQAGSTKCFQAVRPQRQPQSGNFTTY